MQFTINGLASHKQFQIDVTEDDYPKTMLNYLREHDIPVASSCRGERICHRCVLNNEVLSCAITVSDFLFKFGNIVEISYL